MSHFDRKKLLIADDSEINRSILADILGEEFEIFEVADGVEAISAIEKHSTDISAVLLDINMPRMNGFEVLTVMNERHWIEEIPVIIISAENGATQIERAFDLGATDFIMRPFDALLVYRRVINTVLLYTKQKRLLSLVVDQIDEKERRSQMMVDILSHIVEFRNGESGQHIIHVRTFAEVMLRQLQRMTDRYPLTQADISLISMVSSLHDIGKIVIDEKILNKPGRLTSEEFENMKQHTIAGAQMLENVPSYQDAQMVRTAWEICRWHHERYDGRGYPDGLKGDAIPISAQVVALADVYDALTSERCYKKAIPHEKAIQMILNGECGVFNPLLIECLKQVESILSTEFIRVQEREANISRTSLIGEVLQNERLFASERSLRLMDQERMKDSFFSAMTNETRFERSFPDNTLKLSPWGAQKLGLDELIVDPDHDEKLMQVLGKDNWDKLREECLAADSRDKLVTLDCMLNVDGQPRWYRFILQALWSGSNPDECIGMIGKAMDIHNSWTQLNELRRKATHDTATGLLNRASAKEQICKRIQLAPDGNFALVVFDLDHLKHFNDTYGHLAGSRVLKYIADKARQSVRRDDIVARIGGDEFLVFLQYKTNLEGVVQRIFNSLIGTYENVPVSVSMGVSQSSVVGYEYDALFHAADQALYCAKRTGRGRCVYYDDSMREVLSEISASGTDE